MNYWYDWNDDKSVHNGSAIVRIDGLEEDDVKRKLMMLKLRGFKVWRCKIKNMEIQRRLRLVADDLKQEEVTHTNMMEFVTKGCNNADNERCAERKEWAEIVDLLELRDYVEELRELDEWAETKISVDAWWDFTNNKLVRNISYEGSENDVNAYRDLCRELGDRMYDGIKGLFEYLDV
jgi:hypothetical protein